MAGIADGAVIEVANLAGESLAQSTEAARGVEGLIQNAVERELFEFLERLCFTQLAVDDGFAGFAVLVDDAVGAPGEIVVERVRRKLRQCADSHAHILQRIEARGQVARHDGDEPGGQSALRNECGAGAFGELLHRARAGHILGQIQVMSAGGFGRFGDQPGGVIGGGAQHGELAREYLAQGVGLRNVGHDLGNGGRRLEAIQLMLRAVDDRDRVVAGSAQQVRDHGSDFARADDNDAFHGASEYWRHSRPGTLRMVGSF